MCKLNHTDQIFNIHSDVIPKYRDDVMCILAIIDKLLNDIIIK